MSRNYHASQEVSRLVAALKQCGKRMDLQGGRMAHDTSVRAGCDTDKYIGTALITMYSRCGSILHAHAAFNTMIHQDVVAWTALILGYVENGESLIAMEVFTSMDCEPNSVTFLAVFKACTRLGRQFVLNRGVALHRCVKQLGFHTDLFLANTLLDMYTKSGSMVRARSVFDSMPNRDIVSWNILALGYVENGETMVAMDLLTRVDQLPDSLTFVAALKTCVALTTEGKMDKQLCLEKGIAIHRQARERGFDADVFVATNLIEMYSKCGSMWRARSVFDSTVHRNVVLWTSLINGYVENAESLMAVNLFNSMDCEPTSVTFVAALQACTRLATDKQFCMQNGIAMHEGAKQRGFDTDIFVASNLVEMYSKCGSMVHARAVFENVTFRNVVLWTNLISGYVENGESLTALDLFDSMDCEPDSVTFVAAVKACTALVTEKQLKFCLDNGVAIHRQAQDRGFGEDVFVANTLIEMYGKCTSMENAKVVFENMVTRNVYSWNALLLAYVENGDSMAAMDLWMRMDCEADSLTYVALLKACGSRAALGFGQGIHAQVCKLGAEQNRAVAIALVDFYGKCGIMAAAELVHSQDLVSWNALIAGYSSLGATSQVFSLVQDMQRAGLQMDGITFLLILTTCSHAGMVDEGKRQFESMSTYNIRPTIQHYTCVVDMLGRANRLPEALSIVNTMPFQADNVVWRSLLGACRNLDNLETSEIASVALVAYGPDSYYDKCTISLVMPTSGLLILLLLSLSLLLNFIPPPKLFGVIQALKVILLQLQAVLGHSTVDHALPEIHEQIVASPSETINPES